MKDPQLYYINLHALAYKFNVERLMCVVTSMYLTDFYANR